MSANTTTKNNNESYLVNDTKYDFGTSWHGGTNVDIAYLLNIANNKPAADEGNDIYRDLVFIGDDSSSSEVSIGDGSGFNVNALSNQNIGEILEPNIASRITKAVTDIPIIPRLNTRPNVFLALQEWEGVVLNIQDEMFTARLIDITDPKSHDEESDFIIDDLRQDDLNLLEEGAIFRWVIGYDIGRGGVKRRVSQIIFRRLPLWTKHDLLKADDEVKSIMGSINWL